MTLTQYAKMEEDIKNFTPLQVETAKKIMAFLRYVLVDKSTRKIIHECSDELKKQHPDVYKFLSSHMV